MSDKSILIELVNENVIPFSYLRNLKTPTVAILLGFFYILKNYLIPKREICEAVLYKFTDPSLVLKICIDLHFFLICE